ncbi:hypothetical protein NIES2135_06890 [Leptolyngbya boryana NIES-2135]|jgi:hypothetical protein|uniref:Uncharacterized protein n=1 Tax=Leptolyngbya boryana NIES-2135 TaxID=1973484 RepID=A0A1Z4JBP9_LEPBY|nr:MULTISPECIES: hypothetical protein [Leptolyngbya]BAY53877.1 hypothetical protein NIES2135_06890 [Leptolyngbya boryana NIES-2135]MBD2370902.1 hypothetical protein [Leptolyngbya sp. FACHB-161]MBD2377416.1 hypothetical protein [Leptolyngbya sp. FACHB-238]MBD2401824.1 hypothetical protein [Leptolyngbya sp. FACHB-239]MBD2408343.1 hypothetical protein [Leptolyngbya sp. FACHB-402]
MPTISTGTEMIVKNSNPRDEARQLITDWAESIIQAAKQLMYDGEAYLVAVSGLPWYRQGNDTWVDESWWIETARSRYEQQKDSFNRWLIDELEILAHHFLPEYRSAARLRIEQWYEKSAHDPENWWTLAMLVYPEHPIFQDLHEYPENCREWAILANVGYKDAIIALHNNLLSEYENQDWFWVSESLSSIASVGGKSLVASIVSESELQQIRQAFRTLAKKDLANGMLSEEELSEELGQRNCIHVAVQLGWQDVIDDLSRNQSYLRKLDTYDILWWSLTDKRRLVEDFITQVQPHTSRHHTLSEIESESMRLAIAWRRAISV